MSHDPHHRPADDAADAPAAPRSVSPPRDTWFDSLRSEYGAFARSLSRATSPTKDPKAT